MYQLDSVGRLAPSSVDISRAAAQRHAHTSAARENPSRPGPGPFQRLGDMASRRWGTSTAFAPSRSSRLPQLDPAVNDGGCA